MNIDELNKIISYISYIFAQKITDVTYYYENIISVLPGNIYWLDKNNIFLGCNNLQAKNANLNSKDEIVGKTNYDLPWKEQAKELNLVNNKVMRTGKIMTYEEEAFMGNSLKTYLSQKAPLRDKNNNIIGIVGVSIDITEKKKIEADLKLAKKAAEAASHAKTEFIANMSHDIRTPLSGVVGLGNILEKEITDLKIKSKVTDMVKSANELLTMLNEILDVVSIDNLSVHDIKIEPFELSRVIQSVVDLEQSSVDLKQIQLLQTIDNKIPSILIGDHKKIHHILLNLVGNAIKFTQNGYVSIDIKLSKILKDKVELLFTISDTGIGIPKESIHKIFELFYKISPSYKGLGKGHGVGLHIVKTYTELLGGTIRVESEINKGSKFFLYLTFKVFDKNVKQQNVAHQQLFACIKEPTLFDIQDKELELINLEKIYNILVIEDNGISLQVAKSVIEEKKCNVTTAIDGETGLRIAKNNDFDMIVTDIGLPGISGVEFTKQFRNYEKQHNKDTIPIIALTAHAQEELCNECIAAGIDEVICKPINLQKIDELFIKFLIKTKQNKVDSIKKDLNISRKQTVNIHNIASQNTSFSTVSNLIKMDPKLELPETESELFEIDHEMIFDIANAKNILGENSGELLMQLLKDTINKVIPTEISRFITAHDVGDWQAVADIAHKLKGGFLSISLNRAATACKYLERYHKTGKIELLDKLYQQVLRTVELTINRLKPFV